MPVPPRPPDLGAPAPADAPDRLWESDDGSAALMVIGGAEDKRRGRDILVDFVRRAGGDRARIAVVPTASSLGQAIVDVYAATFRDLGAAEIVSCAPESRQEASSPELVARLASVTGIFMTGGNQLKLSQVVAGTPFGDAVVAARDRGVVVAGTSAGASIQSSHMVAFGRGGATPRQRMTQVAAGLGLVQGCVIDQHFEQRNRYGRLITIVAQSPQLLALGVDEDTAAVVVRREGRDVMRVVGRGSVTVLDGSTMVSNAHEAPRTTPLLVSGVTLHALPAGSTYDLTDRRLVVEDDSADPLQRASASGRTVDLRDLARDLRRTPTRRRRTAAPTDRTPETHEPLEHGDDA